ncbi:MAG: hypothetical protein R3D26_20880 [Cyanobacteriota/Melainabacteria group bacterium]
MSIASAGSPRDQVAVRDRVKDTGVENGLSTQVADRFREELGSIFGPRSGAGQKTADRGTVKDGGDVRAQSKPGDTDTVPGKIKELEAKYGVHFARPGEQKPRQLDNEGNAKGKELDIRDPNMRELKGVEAALSKASPSHKGADGKPLTFYFLKDKSFSPGSDGAAAYHPNVNGRPAVVVDPGSTDKAPITEKDRKDPGHADHNNHRSIESLIIHELAHNSEEKVFKNPSEQADFYRKIGWDTIPGQPPGPGSWMLKGKDGRGYAPPADGGMGKWERINRDGRVSAKVDRERVERLAKEKPATDYFEGPHEMLAEAATMLKLGDGHRSHLMEKNPKLYNLIKGFDQREIDQSFGKGKFIRSYEGHLVPNNDANLKALRDQEEAARRAIRGR